MSSNIEFLPHWIAISRLQGFTVEGALVLLDKFGDFQSVWEASSNSLSSASDDGGLSRAILKKRNSIRISKYVELVEEAIRTNVSILTIIGENYPSRLRSIPDPPPTLFVRGNTRILDSKSIAIVGTRSPSDFGQDMSRTLSRQLAKIGYTIISGLAYGIDSAAHQGALEASGLTVAVLASSVNDVTPKRNEALAEDIVDNDGALLSEYMATDFVGKANFVKRNRIIAGLSNGTIIVEGTARSGTRHQARYCRELNRPIFTVVPEDIEAEQAELPGILLKEGAIAVRDSGDVSRYLNRKGSSIKKHSNERKFYQETLE